MSLFVKARRSEVDLQNDLFKVRLSELVNPDHKLCRLANWIDWENLEGEEDWLESPYWQWFCGETFFQHEFPCYPTSLVKGRQRLGEEGCEWLLAATLQAGLKGQMIHPVSLKRVVVDSTVQAKNIAYPIGSRLYDQARRRLVEVARELDITSR